MNEHISAEEGFRRFYRLIRQRPGARLFTILALDPDDGSLTRVYTNSPEFNPVGARKTTEVDPLWRQRCIEKQKIYFGPTLEDIRTVFTDWQAIRDFGCGSVINLPVTSDGKVVGVVNLLAAEGQYTPETVSQLDILVATHRQELTKLIVQAYQKTRTPVA